jgi:hypothetical protein
VLQGPERGSHGGPLECFFYPLTGRRYLPFRRRTWRDFIQIWLAALGILGLAFTGVAACVAAAQKSIWPLLTWLGVIIVLGSINLAVSLRRKQDVLALAGIERVIFRTLALAGAIVAPVCPFFVAWLFLFTRH